MFSSFNKVQIIMTENTDETISRFLIENPEARYEIGQAIHAFLLENPLVRAGEVGKHVVYGDRVPQILDYINGFVDNTELVKRYVADSISWFVTAMVIDPMLDKIDTIEINRHVTLDTFTNFAEALSNISEKEEYYNEIPGELMG